EEKTRYLKMMVYTIALPFIANTVGWLMTEMGRQPWVVFGVMQTKDAVSPTVTANDVLFALLDFTTLYVIMGGVAIYLYVRHIKKENRVDGTPGVASDPYDTKSYERGGSKVVSQ